MRLADVLELAELSGALARAGGRPRDDCPYDPDNWPGPYEAWTRGWDALEEERCTAPR